MQRKLVRAAAIGAILLSLIAIAGLMRPQLRAAEDPHAHHMAQESPPAEKTSERKIKYYRNPMGLPDTSPTPKKDSMGMDYIPVYEDEHSDDHAITLSPGKIQRSGVETAIAGKQVITRTIKAPGAVALDERSVAVIAPRYEGFVESVGAATTGTHVKQGDPLVTVFGQELLNQGARLIIEQLSGAKADGATAPGVIGARRRLLNLGVSEDIIEQIKRDRKVPDTITLRAPRDGVVLERNVVDGQAFKAGDVLFRIADHSTVWMMADVAEGDMSAIRPGQSVKVTTRANPGRVFEGTASVVYPHLTKETRTVRVRVELPNPDLALLPDMYGEVEIATGAEEKVIAVPASAVIDTGRRKAVLLDLGEGRYEPRDVGIGRTGNGQVEITNGIAEGDKVVVNGNFLIDSESNLQSALKALSPSGTEAAR